MLNQKSFTHSTQASDSKDTDKSVLKPRPKYPGKIQDKLSYWRFDYSGLLWWGSLQSEFLNVVNWWYWCAAWGMNRTLSLDIHGSDWEFKRSMVMLPILIPLWANCDSFTCGHRSICWQRLRTSTWESWSWMLSPQKRSTSSWAFLPFTWCRN